MRSVLFGLGLAVFFVAIGFMTRDGSAADIAREVASDTVFSARASGQWQNVRLEETPPQKPQRGLWMFTVTVRDLGYPQKFWLPVRQVCDQSVKRCFRAMPPERHQDR